MGERKKIPDLIALKQIIEVTSAFTGKEFFRSLVKNLAEVLGVYGVWITEFRPAHNKLNALAFWLNGSFVEHYEYAVSNTPCEPVLENYEICHIPNKVIDLYPKDPDLKTLGAVSYMGISLRDSDDSVMGHLALLDNKPMPEIPDVLAIFKILAIRATAELQREIAQHKVRENESKLDRLVNGTTDAILEFNSDFIITQSNAAAFQMFKISAKVFQNKKLQELFNAQSYSKLKSIIPQHDVLSNKYCSFRFKEPLICIDNNAESFPAETSISHYEYKNDVYYVLYIRNIKDLILDKTKIRELNTETFILKEKVDTQEFSYIIGNSPPIKECLELVHQVGPTDANVLLHGETGTGKELFSKAVHDASTRNNNPMVMLNCAALPSELIESELFGHKKGAFTGALTDREGRFSLADKGTLFLDEIAELSLPLQAKLLRVIQEGTFEPVGSSESKSVDVRIIAATHRDLTEQIEQGNFREDLYYRLNVFPIHIPPLRERGEDIELLARAFFDKITKNMALSVLPISKQDLTKLKNYQWPGNVRELQNIIERAIITSKEGKLNFEGIIPKSAKEYAIDLDDIQILNYEEIVKLERENIIKALNITNWKISGDGGAADLLKIPRTTLTSKIKKLDIRRVAL